MSASVGLDGACGIDTHPAAPQLSAHVGCSHDDPGQAARVGLGELGLDNLEPDAVERSTKASLQRLRTEYLDLLLIHWPNPSVPLEETLGAMNELRQAGLVRHLGVSNLPVELFERARGVTDVICNQVEYHPYLSQRRLLHVVRQRGAALVAYSPLAKGRVIDDGTLADIGRAHGKSASQVALRWLVQQDHVVAIPKASSREHLDANRRVFDFELGDDEMQRIAGLERGERLIDPGWAPDWD